MVEIFFGNNTSLVRCELVITYTLAEPVMSGLLTFLKLIYLLAAVKSAKFSVVAR